MTLEIFLLYVLTRLNAVGIISFIGCILSGLALFGTIMYWMCTVDSYFERNEDKIKQAVKLVKYARNTLIAFVLIAALVPSKNDALFIVAGTGVIEAAKSDTAQRIASKSVNIVENYLDKLEVQSK